jgi:C4-type Zn-finger protein
MISQSGRTIVPDAIDRFKGLCPVCGEELKLKKIKNGRNGYRRSLRSFVCEKCGVAEYDSNPREKGILDGGFDEI